MSLIRKSKEEMKNVHKNSKGPYIFTLLMVILFAVIALVMLGIMVTLFTVQDMSLVTKYVEENHSYYQRQERTILDNLCQEYKNMNILLKNSLTEDQSLGNVVEQLKLANALDTEQFLLVDDSGEVVYPQDWYAPAFSEEEKGKLFDQEKPVFRIEDENNRIYYCGGVKYGDQNIVLMDSSSKIDEILEHRVSWRAQCENIKVGERGVVIPVSKSSRQQHYYPDDMVALDNIDDLVKMSKANAGVFTLDNETYFCYMRKMYDNDTILVAMYPVEEMISSVISMTAVSTLIFAVTMGIILIYTVTMIRLRKKGERSYRWKKLPGGLYYDRKAGKQMFIYSGLALMVMVILTYYTQTLIGISSNTSQAFTQLDSVSDTYDAAYKDSSKAGSYITHKRENLLCMMTILETDKVSLENKLDQLLHYSSNIYAVEYYDLHGNLVKSSDAVSGEPDKEEQQEVAEVREGISKNIFFMSGIKGGDGIPSYQNLAMTILGKDGPTGFAIIKIAENKLPGILDKSLLKDKLLSVRAANGGTAFSIDYKTGKFSFYPGERLAGRIAVKYGMEEDDLRDGFSGYITVNGVDKYAVSILEKSQYIYLSMEEWEMMFNRVPTLVVSLIAGVLCIFFLFLSVTVKRKPGKNELVDGVRGTTGKDASSELILKITRWILFITAVLVTIVHLFYGILLPENSLLYYIFEGNWDKGLNIFSYTMCIVIICETCVLIYVSTKLLDMISEILSRRGTTICRLLSSLVKYVGIIVAFFMCVANFGVNMRMLVVSAGILTTVLGLGATSLLTDIFAGLFMTFEGDMQVGDAMIIDTFLGRIVEIGIRTTKFLDSDDNTLIVNNRLLTGPIKRERAFNYCHSFIDMDYDESLDRVEAFLAAELPGLREKLPFLLSEPEYRGVVSLLDQHMRIDIRYKASAADRFMAEQEMNRELKLIFDKYHLSLNITEDYRMTDIVYLPAEPQDPEEAQEFMKERWRERRS